jgi:hypothetical protein
MATVKFSVPDEIKDAFNEAFKGQNKSAVVAELMREAVARAQRRQQSHDAIGRILDRRPRAPILSDKEIGAIRESGRP